MSLAGGSVRFWVWSGGSKIEGLAGADFFGEALAGVVLAGAVLAQTEGAGSSKALAQSTAKSALILPSSSRTLFAYIMAAATERVKPLSRAGFPRQREAGGPIAAPALSCYGTADLVITRAIGGTP